MKPGELAGLLIGAPLAGAITFAALYGVYWSARRVFKFIQARL